jgi:hypothetical protein
MWIDDIISWLTPYTWEISVCTCFEEWLHLEDHIHAYLEGHATFEGPHMPQENYYLHTFPWFVSRAIHLGGL